MKLRNVLTQALIVLVSTVVCLAALEGFLRFKNSDMRNYDIEMWRYARELKRPADDPTLGHVHVPNAEAHLQSVDIRINEAGLRGGPVPPLPEGGRRILFLGSSVTLGWGVPEDEVLTSRLQRRFEADGAKVQVLNAGIGNYNAQRYVDRFLERLTALQPTDVVVQYFVNDAELLAPGGGNLLLRHSQLAVTVYIALNRLFAATGEQALADYYRALYADGSRGDGEMAAALGRLGAFAKAHGIRLYLLMTPDFHNLVDYKLGFIHERMKRLAAALGYVYIDLLQPLSGIDPASIWAMPGDPHPNALGHKLMADAVYPVLAQLR